MNELENDVASVCINNAGNAGSAQQTTKQLSSDSSKPEELMSPEQPLNVCHPLQYNWKLHYFKLVPGEKWVDAMHELAEFHTVEDFCCLYIKIIKPSLLSVSSSFYLFKSQIKPMWEDPQNVYGGRWSFVLRNDELGSVDICWEQMLFAVLGEAFEQDGPHVCGIVVSVKQKKQGFKLSVWTDDCTDKQMNERIGSKVKEVCGLGCVRFRYEDHQSAQRGYSPGKPRYLYSL